MKPSPLLLAHRGACASGSIQENTIPAFELALQHGCDGFEFDVRLTKDGKAIVCHNARFARTTIAKAPATRLQELPRLADVLDCFAKRAFLDIELKVPGLESELLSALVEHPPERGLIVSSFLSEVVMDLAARSASVPLGFICDKRRELKRWPELPVQYVIAHRSLITPDLVSEIHVTGRLLFSWTVNRKSAMLRHAEWGVDGVISDETELLVDTLRT